MKPLLLLASSGMLFFTACAPSYNTNLTTAPLLYDKGEIAGAFNVSNTGLEAQGAYALTDHIAGASNISYGFFSGDRSFNWEGAMGLYTVRGKKDNMHLEIFGGGGIGSGNAEGTTLFTNSSFRESGRFTKLFIQPNFGINNKAFEFALSSRFTYVRYSELTVDNYVITPLPRAVMIEPLMSFRFGIGGNRFFEHTKLSLNLGLSLPLTGEVDFDYNPLQIGLGLMYHSRQYNRGFIGK
jgi:hypothetical protein